MQRGHAGCYADGTERQASGSPCWKKGVSLQAPNFQMGSASERLTWQRLKALLRSWMFAAPLLHRSVLQSGWVFWGAGPSWAGYVWKAMASDPTFLDSSPLAIGISLFVSVTWVGHQVNARRTLLVAPVGSVWTKLDLRRSALACITGGRGA